MIFFFFFCIFLKGGGGKNLINFLHKSLGGIFFAVYGVVCVLRIVAGGGNWPALHAQELQAGTDPCTSPPGENGKKKEKKKNVVLIE